MSFTPCGGLPALVGQAVPFAAGPVAPTTGVSHRRRSERRCDLLLIGAAVDRAYLGVERNATQSLTKTTPLCKAYQSIPPAGRSAQSAQ